MPDPLSQKELSLTQEEAFALLEMCTLTLASEGPAHLCVLSRLGSLCREMLTLPPGSEKVVGQEHPPYTLCSHSQDGLTIACLY